MGKHKKWTLEDKVKIVKEFKKGATISYLNNKYDISGCGTVSRWNKEYGERRLDIDNRGKKNIIQKSRILTYKKPMLFWWKSALSNINRKISNNW